MADTPIGMYNDSTLPRSDAATARHIPAHSTVAALLERKNGHSWRAVAVALHYPPSYAATLCKVAARRPGGIARAAERVLRQRLGLPGTRRAVVGIGGLQPHTRDRLATARRACGLTWDAYLTHLANLAEGIDGAPAGDIHVSTL